MTALLQKRTPLPALVHRYPECPICEQEVDGDGESLWCETCGGTWPTQGGELGEANPEVEQCRAEVEPYRDVVGMKNLGAYRYRCIRDAGHPDDILLGHVGVREGAKDDQPFAWRDGQYPQVTAASTP